MTGSEAAIRCLPHLEWHDSCAVATAQFRSRNHMLTCLSYTSNDAQFLEEWWVRRGRSRNITGTAPELISRGLEGELNCNWTSANPGWGSVVKSWLGWWEPAYAESAKCSPQMAAASASQR